MSRISLPPPILLESDGYEVFCAGCAEDGFEKNGRNQAQPAVAGLRLPEMSGFQLATKMRSTDAYKDIPIVVMSGMSDTVSRHIAAKHETVGIPRETGGPRKT